MKEIPLHRCIGNGRWGPYKILPETAVIDDDDETLVVTTSERWLLHSEGYAYTNVGGKALLMHRLILGLDDPGIHTDHFDHDRLNNRKSNIKACSQAENNQNLPYKGYGPFRNKWRAWHKTTGRYIGIYETEEEAERAVNEERLVDR